MGSVFFNFLVHSIFTLYPIHEIFSVPKAKISRFLVENVDFLRGLDIFTIGLL